MDTIVDQDQALANRLQLERQSRGWSLAEVAKRSGISKAMVRKVELGEASPTAALLVRLAGAFETDSRTGLGIDRLRRAIGEEAA